jgi:hypothetical protein
MSSAWSNSLNRQCHADLFAPAGRSTPVPDFQSYPEPSAALDAALMREVDLSAVPLNALQTSIMNAILELHGTDLAAMGMRLAEVSLGKCFRGGN